MVEPIAGLQPATSARILAHPTFPVGEQSKCCEIRFHSLGTQFPVVLPESTGSNCRKQWPFPWQHSNCPLSPPWSTSIVLFLLPCCIPADPIPMDFPIGLSLRVHQCPRQPCHLLVARLELPLQMNGIKDGVFDCPSANRPPLLKAVVVGSSRKCSCRLVSGMFRYLVLPAPW